MIIVDDLSFTYEGGRKEAITGLTFAIDRGEIFGFLGPSGAGKSTTQKVLTQLLRQYAGRVSAFNRNLKGWGPDYFEQIGVSFEFPTHFLKLTGIENLTYFSRLYWSRLGRVPPWQFLFGLDPLYWPVKFFGEVDAAISSLYLGVALIFQLFILYLLFRRIRHRTSSKAASRHPKVLTDPDNQSSHSVCIRHSRGHSRCFLTPLAYA